MRGHLFTLTYFNDSFLFLGSSIDKRKKKITKQIYPASKRILIYIYKAIRH